jgi:hypothetical protein
VSRPVRVEENRAMERRRFVPSGEGLEGRALLSFFGGSVNKFKQGTDQNVPLTWFQKEARIDHLPFYLNQVQTKRFLPVSTITNLKADLHDLMGHLSSPTSTSVDDFNLTLRDAYKHTSISTAEATALNRTFGAVLIKAGATPEQTIRLQSDMNQLAFVDTKSIDPSLLITNDYALTLQTAMAAGRPIKRPDGPTLHKNDGVSLDNGLLARTRDHTPTFVGTYNVGIKGIGITDIQIVTANGNVLGVGKIEPTLGTYSVKIAKPLSDGTYDLYTRAIDNQGHMSDLSFHHVQLKVVSPPVPKVTKTVVITTTAGGVRVQ